MSCEWRSSSSTSRILSSYEISDDLNRRQIQVLERRYGGRLRAHAAATRIQRAFRNYRMKQHWRRYVQPLQQHSAPVLPYSEGVTSWGPEPRLFSKTPNLRSRTAPVPKSIHHTSNVFPHSYTNLQTAFPARYHPLVPLSAQLRASRAKERRSSPSPCRAVAECAAHRPFIELMSPRLSHRRIVGESVSETNQNHVWVPRYSGFTRAVHTNSLPRIDVRTASTLSTLSTTSAVSAASASSSAEDWTPRLSRAHARLSDQLRRRQYRIAFNFFNKKPDRGMDLLLKWGFLEDTPSAVAKLLITRQGLSKQMIGEYLGQLRDPFHSAVLECFIDEIDLRGVEIDVALRHVLTFFQLPGEAQKIERIMQVFSRRYMACNRERAAKFHSADTVFILSYAIIMLNTDLHKPKTKSHAKMKLEDFIKNLRGIDGGHDIDRNDLVGIYGRIRDHEFRPGTDHLEKVMKVDRRIIDKEKPKLVEPHRRLVCSCTMSMIPDRSKRQAANAHQRKLHIFNDMLLVVKVVSKKKDKDSEQYTVKYLSSLIGLRFRLFDSPFYSFGLHIVFSDGLEMSFHTQNEEDMHRFVNDLRESVAECAEMEAVRIECELDKHSGLSRNDVQRDSGLPDIDGVPPTTNGRSLSDGSTSSASATAIPLSSRRLSFNSLDSGVVEEHNDSIS